MGISIDTDITEEYIEGESVIPCKFFKEEQFILAQLGDGNRFNTIKDAFGYKIKDGELMLVAEILKENGVNEHYLVGATGTNFSNTEELEVMNYKESMATVNCEEWEKSIKFVHEKMVKYNIFQVVKKEDTPKGTKLMNFTWVMKMKSNRVYQTRLAICGFQQKEVEQYQADNKLAPVINNMSIKIILTLIILGKWFTKIVDVKGAFLHNNFQ